LKKFFVEKPSISIRISRSFILSLVKLEALASQYWNCQGDMLSEILRK